MTPAPVPVPPEENMDPVIQHLQHSITQIDKHIATLERELDDADTVIRQKSAERKQVLKDRKLLEQAIRKLEQ